MVGAIYMLVYYRYNTILIHIVIGKFSSVQLFNYISHINFLPKDQDNWICMGASLHEPTYHDIYISIQPLLFFA